jgi:phospholipase/lecithinase/hemolysin
LNVGSQPDFNGDSQPGPDFNGGPQPDFNGGSQPVSDFNGGTQPSASFLLGTFPGATSVYGKNWVYFLLVTYNASTFLSYDLAVSGATLDSDIVAPASPSIPSVKQQITNEFLPGYRSPIVVPTPSKWAGNDTLFTIWIGINDIGATFTNTSATANISQELISEYASLVEQLYAAGARNFVFITVPTIDRSPRTIARGATVAEQERVDVAQWNQLLVAMAKDTKAQHEDSNVWIFEMLTHSFPNH